MAELKFTKIVIEINDKVEVSLSIEEAKDLLKILNDVVGEKIAPLDMFRDYVPWRPYRSPWLTDPWSSPFWCSSSSGTTFTLSNNSSGTAGSKQL